MERIEINAVTGQKTVVPLTAEEEAAAIARSAQEAAEQASILAQQAADSAAKDAAKLDAVIRYLVTHTPDECAQYVQDNVVDLASARAFLKKVAMALSVLARKDLR